MSLSKKLTIASATAFTASNAAVNCKISDYKVWYTEFVQGFQAEPTDYDNDCFVATGSFVDKTHEVFESFREFKVDDWLEPIYTIQEDLVEFTGVFSNCQTTNAAKQLMTRTTKLSGFFEVFASIGSAYLKNNQKAGSSELYNSIQLVFNPTTTDCKTQALNAGITFSLLLNYEAPTAVYYDMLTTQLM